MPIDERLMHSLRASWRFAAGDLFWYALFAGGVYLTFYVVFRRTMRTRKIVPQLPQPRQMVREVLLSLRSMAIFGLTGGVVVFLALCGIRPHVYRNFAEYGMGWYVGSIVLAVLIHDTYFYWTHRLLHHPALFRRFHLTHHQSNNPTPWAAYSFSAGEAAVQAGIGPLLVYMMPMHYSAFVAFMTLQITFNVLGHCGYEVLPRRFMRGPAAKLLNSVTHHAMHHEKVHANYGLYFNVWDRLMGTNHPEYVERFEQVTHAADSRTVTVDAPLTAGEELLTAGG